MTVPTPRTSFASTTRGIDRNSVPMRLFEKAKKFGVWNPSSIDMTQDVKDWASFSDLEREFLLHVLSFFQGGEEAVTLDLLPLIMTIAKEGRLEEEMFLTTFLWEEAKHVDFFGRFLSEIAVGSGDLTRFQSADYNALFHDALPNALQALTTDSSPEAQIRASVTYNMIVEGVLAETGYHGIFTAIDSLGVLPGLREGIYRLKQDESRHIAYGLYLLSRLIEEDPALFQVAEDTMNALLPHAMGVISDIFMVYETPPFNLDMMEFTMFAMGQFEKRMGVLERAKSGPVDRNHFTPEAA